MLVEYGQMYVTRDFLSTLQTQASLEAVLLWGPRQSGKTTLLDQVELNSKFFLDDLGVRDKAQRDPALFFLNVDYPCLIDEAQYAPNLFPEIKLRIDKLRRANLKSKSKIISKPHFYLTGSNRLMLDEQIKESLAGRCHLFTLHGLSVAEILRAFPDTKIQRILFTGGYPELYAREGISTKQYLNDYILSFVEKDIARSAGVEKINEFHTVLRLLAARSGQYLNVTEVSKLAGVEQDTVSAWLFLLQRNFILEAVPTYASNISKRAVKMKKLFFYDVGLCSRLQGHQDESSLWGSAQAGALFETLVFSEIVKTRDNFLKEWSIYSWRTKDKNEIDFVVDSPKGLILIEAKMAIHGAKSFELDPEAKKIFKKVAARIVVTAGGDKGFLDKEVVAVPIQELGHYISQR